MTFEWSPSGLVGADSSGQIVMANLQVEMIFGYSKEELIGQPIELLCPSDKREPHAAMRVDCMKDPKPRMMTTGRDLHGQHKDGRLIPLDIGLNPVRLGTETYILTAIVDITDREKSRQAMKAANDTLLQSNRDLEEFAYVASHDLQEPLRKISAYAQLLLDECGDDLNKEGQDYIRVVVDGASRLKELVTDLLGFSRINNQGRDLCLTSSQECLELALSNLEVAVEESRAKISTDSLPAVIADKSQLTMLFQNLINNSIKYCEEAPRIHVGGRDAGDTFEFFVRDNGIGIEPQYFDRIFGVFKRLHGRNEYSGTGIGLANCKRIIERFGGRIWVDSTLGEGSVFYFTITKALAQELTDGIKPEFSTTN